MQNFRQRAGFTLFEMLIAIALIALIFWSVYLTYASILDTIGNTSVRRAAVSVLNNEIETIRNLPYESVGTVGGVPSGILPQEKQVTVGDVTFTVTTTVRNIDDPFDGTLGGTPNDTAPADYKLVAVKVSCKRCSKFQPIEVTTTVAPKHLESSSENGSLFIHVFDANGVALQGIPVHVVNNKVLPPIDLTDTTNADGVLQLVDVPTSTQGYEITVTDTGYSQDQTYTPGDPQNPNPLKPHATVVSRQVTNTSFSIDKVSTVLVKTQDKFCAPQGNKHFSMQGAKLIGTNPDVLKFSTTSVTDSAGEKLFTNIEWDSYSFALLEAGDDVVGTLPLSPMEVAPSSTNEFAFVLQPANPKSLLVTVRDSVTGNPVAGAQVRLEKPGFSATKITGMNSFGQSDWSGGNYSAQSGTDTDSTPGTVTMAANGGVYSTTTTAWLVSKTFDLGTSSTTFSVISWNPTSQPPGTTLKIQLASNNDNATWNFIGPDGTPSSYYTVSGAAIGNFHDGHRYLRYKVYLATQDSTQTPSLEDITFTFGSDCLPPAQALFSGLGAGTYSLYVSATGYFDYSASTTVSADWQQEDVEIIPSI